MDPGNIRTVTVSARGAARWAAGHPWIYRSDLTGSCDTPGLVRVLDPRGRFLGQALHSPASEIRLRLLERAETLIDGVWWERRLRTCLAQRDPIDATGYRVVHGEGDGLPSLIVDRYDRWAVVQLLSAGLETFRQPILDAIERVLAPAGILLRHDASVRRHEGLSQQVELARGEVPERIEIREGGVRYAAAPWTGQKTGAFLDQRPNRLRAGALARPGGRALDCFSYHGSFALHLARTSAEVLAVEQSEEAVARGMENAGRNGLTNVFWRPGNAFDVLAELDRARERFDTIVLDPPAFAKTRDALVRALRGYHEINRRAMRLLAPGGILVTASCSYHLRRPDFEAMLASAAGAAARRVVVLERLGQGIDHPEVLTIPETGYLKGAALAAE